MSLGLGIVGLGTAGAAMLSAARRRDDLRLVAVADVRVDELGLEGLDVHLHASLEEILADDSVDAVHLATPTPMHFAHVNQALDAGRHVIVEKPVTCDTESARRLLARAREQDRVVIVGHSESFEPYVAAARDAVAAGEIGEPAMIIAEKFTDWMRRPRLAEEWDPTMGGGLIRRQGVHQIDVVRTVVGADYSVTAALTRTDPQRQAPGSYCAWLGSVGSTCAFISHDGIGRLSGADPVESSGPDASDHPGKRLRSRLLLDRALREYPLRLGRDDGERILVLGSTGEVTATRDQVTVTGPEGRRTVPLGDYPSGRDAVLDELIGAVESRHPARHDVAWGAESLRLCEEIERFAEASRQ
jgi:phthalate 4,5-cis-dihydrodiol dehydrogenase